MDHRTADSLRKYTVDPGTGCWNWDGRLWPNGYGHLPTVAGFSLAHRLFYTEHVGPIPNDRVIDHLCCNKQCVNPAHLEPVTKAENGRRGLWSLYNGHCRKGHDLRVPESRYIEAATGRTMCCACRDAREARRRARRVDKIAA